MIASPITSLPSQSYESPSKCNDDSLDFSPRSKLGANDDFGFFDHQNMASRSTSFDTYFDSMETPLKTDDKTLELPTGFRCNLMNDFMVPMNTTTSGQFKFDLFDEP